MPPRRLLGFNSAITHNDGMLTSSIARHSGLSYEGANQLLTQAVNDLKARYAMNGQVSLPRIGTFKGEEGGQMIFTPDTSAESIVSVAYGALPVINLTTAQEDADATALDAIQFKSKPWWSQGLRPIGKIAASIAILASLAITLSTPIVYDKEGAGYASMATPKVSASQKAVVPSASPAPELYIAIPREEIEPEVEPANPWRCETADRYFLIVASMETRRMAEKYLNERPNEFLSILERDGRFRVYVATGRTFEEARSPMSNPAFLSLHPDAWVYRR